MFDFFGKKVLVILCHECGEQLSSEEIEYSNLFIRYAYLCSKCKPEKTIFIMEKTNEN